MWKLKRALEMIELNAFLIQGEDCAQGHTSSEHTS